MTIEEAIEVNSRVGNMILAIQREFWTDYQSIDWRKNTKIGQLYVKLVEQRDELSNWLLWHIQ